MADLLKDATVPMDPIDSKKGDTWPKVLKYNHDVYGDKRKAMRHKRMGIWQPYTWQDYYRDVKYLALGLLSIGFEPGDKVLIIGENTPQWYYAQIAVQSLRGVCVGLYNGLQAEEILGIAEQTQARWAIVDDQEQVDKMMEIKDQLSDLQKIIHWTYKGLSEYKDSDLLGYREVMEAGKAFQNKQGDSFEQYIAAGRADDICAIVYTAGTTRAKPLGVMHTFATMMSSARACLDLDAWRDEDNVLPTLPPTWIFEQCFSIGCHLLSACTLNFAESPVTQQRDTRETGPSIVINRSGWWEAQAARVQARILAADAFKRFVYQLVMPIGFHRVDLRLNHRKPGLLHRLLYLLGDGVLFRALKKSLGLQHARICYSTGGLLCPEVIKFFHALNLPLKSIYGSTEAGILAGASNDDFRPDTVGPALDGIQTRVTENGELMFHHAGLFVGYYGEPEKTAEATTDGWFHSGDRGDLRQDGHIVLQDRIGAIVRLAEGDLAPQMVESRLRFSPFIKYAWVIGQPGQGYAAAVIVIDYEHVSHWAGGKKLQFSTFTELSQQPAVTDQIKSVISDINQHLPPTGRILKFVNFHKEFNPDDGELTKSLSLRRFLLKDRYQALIQAVYDNGDTVPVETQIRDENGEPTHETITLHIESVEGTVS